MGDPEKDITRLMIIAPDSEFGKSKVKQARSEAIQEILISDSFILFAKKKETTPPNRSNMRIFSTIKLGDVPKYMICIKRWITLTHLTVMKSMREGGDQHE